MVSEKRGVNYSACYIEKIGFCVRTNVQLLIRPNDIIISYIPTKLILGDAEFSSRNWQNGGGRERPHLASKFPQRISALL